MTKVCTKCGEEKPLDEFYKKKTGQLGVTGECKKCVSVRGKKYRSKTGIKSKVAQYGKTWRGTNSARVKENSLKFHYGIDLKDYNKRFTEQRGCCAICGKHQSQQKRALAVDHNHVTKQVRELLCMKCNIAIGAVDENILVLEKMLAYLRKHNG